MKKAFGFVALVLLGALLTGCGGSSVSKTSIVTGSILDINFNPVREARVFASGVETYSGSTGTYQLQGVADGIVEVRAEIVQNGTVYRGRTQVLNFEATQTNNATIIVSPEGQIGRIVGKVRDLDGFELEGASVFAFNGTGSSQRAFTDRNGNFVLDDLMGGVVYTLSAGGRGYASDQVDVAVVAGGSREVNFTLTDAGLPFLDIPQNIGVTSWVSPAFGTRSAGQANPYTWIKTLADKRDRSGRKATKSRAIRDDLIVEVELFWDQQQFPDLLGYGVYRAASDFGALVEYDFLAEPLAAYYVDIGPNVNSTYSYALTTLATLYPDFAGTESNLSDRVVVDTLDLLTLGPVFTNPVRFTWSAFSGAEEFVVYVFSDFPGVGIQPFWDNENAPVTGTSVDYTGPGLVSGHTYYYVVLGSANGGSSRTISEIGSFQP